VGVATGGHKGGRVEKTGREALALHVWLALAVLATPCKASNAMATDCQSHSVLYLPAMLFIRFGFEHIQNTLARIWESPEP
jgi:hypothetical protein